MQDYGAINAKIGAMRSFLLCERDFRDLASVKTVDGVARSLSERKPYAPYLTTEEGTLGRAGAERKLMFSLSADFAGIMGFINDAEARRCLLAYYTRIDIRVLTGLLSSALDNRGYAYTDEELRHLRLFGGRLNTDYARLASSSSIEEFIENTRSSEYFIPLNYKRDGAPTINGIQAALDAYCRMKQRSVARKNRSNPDNAVLRHINGTEIDLRNISYIYRLKTYYNADANAIYTHLVPVHYRLDGTQVTKMAEAKSYGELKNEIMDTAYGVFFKDALDAEPPPGRPGNAFNNLESALYKGMKWAFRKVTAQSPRSLAAALSYLFDKETEINNVVSVLEGITYGYAPGRIMESLTLQRE